jgi:hypothetical protein
MVSYAGDMENTPTYDRPNTVIGLVAKRKELSDLRERHHAEIKKLTVDIDHLDAAIRLFDPAKAIGSSGMQPGIAPRKEA